jgi:hypothetical protein
MIVLCHPWLRKENKVLRSYLNILRIEIRYLVLDIWSLCGTFYAISMFFYKNNGSWGLHHGQDVGTCVLSNKFYKEQGTEIVLGLDTGNSDM